MKNKIIGIDIGGTAVKFGLLNLKGDILEKWEIATVRGDEIIDSIYHSVLTKISSEEIQNHVLGIGVGAPGFIDQETGVEAVNLGWKNFELSKRLQDKFAPPVSVENDANIAALGEYWKEKENRVTDLIFITLGTGVGSGIIANGSILKGVNGTAGEIGHTIVDYNGYQCNCGRVGCLDTISSATGIVRKAMDKIRENPASMLADFYSTHGSINSIDVFSLASKGDKDCIEIINYSAKMLGIALANTSAIINPSKILIGGGLSKAGDQLLDLVKLHFKHYSLNRIVDITKIELAKLGNDAGIIGAAYLVMNKG